MYYFFFFWKVRKACWQEVLHCSIRPQGGATVSLPWRKTGKEGAANAAVVSSWWMRSCWWLQCFVMDDVVVSAAGAGAASAGVDWLDWCTGSAGADTKISWRTLHEPQLKSDSPPAASAPPGTAFHPRHDPFVYPFFIRHVIHFAGCSLYETSYTLLFFRHNTLDSNKYGVLY